jgi:hypothetical protein
MHMNMPELDAAVLVDEPVTAAMAETPADNAMNSLLLMRDTAFCNPLIIKGARENSRILP